MVDYIEQPSYADDEPDRLERRLRVRVESYGITLDEYYFRLKAQGNRCAICGATAPGGKGDWHIDHDHATGKVRGLLCLMCNVGLGMFKDEPLTLVHAIDYVLSARRG